MEKYAQNLQKGDTFYLSLVNIKVSTCVASQAGTEVIACALLDSAAYCEEKIDSKNNNYQHWKENMLVY